MLKRVPALLMALSLTATVVPGSVLAQGTVNVYVGPAGQEAGFAAVGADDSVRDLEKALAKKKRLSLVRARQDADIVVLVDSRENHWENVGSVNSWTDSKGKTHVYTAPKNTRVVHATLIVGDYRLPLHGENFTWSGASERVAGDVDKWVDQNIVPLIERRSERK